MMKNSSEVPGRLVLGIDPGTRVTGWGLVHRHGNRFSCVGFGAWQRPKDRDLPSHLAWLMDALTELVAAHKPQEIIIEEAFVGKNSQSALRLGEARGALMAASAKAGIIPHEYPTAVVKKSVVGNGRADKTQVQFMVQKLLSLREAPTPLDASDALAVALAFALHAPLSARG